MTTASHSVLYNVIHMQAPRKWKLRSVLVYVPLCLLLAAAMQASVAAADAATTYVDGISDQTMSSWDHGLSGNFFDGFFAKTWVKEGHIKLARYVVQWNAISSYPAYRSLFENWLTDATSLGLTPEVALTSYTGIYPASSAEYKARLLELLKRAEAIGHPIRYLEAWNEPNNQGGLNREDGVRSAVAAAHYTNEAYAACEEGHGCAVIAGDVEDSPGAREYEQRYEAQLKPVPKLWGVHPYYSVEKMEESHYTEVREGLPNKGSGDQIWFTEIAARKCSPSKENGESGQSERAKWLVDTLMPFAGAEHVFYYDFLTNSQQQPACSEYDGALYLPGSDLNASDVPRPAASYILSNHDLPATLTGSVYPGGPLNARFHFEDTYEPSNGWPLP